MGDECFQGMERQSVRILETQKGGSEKLEGVEASDRVGIQSPFSQESQLPDQRFELSRNEEPVVI